MIYTVARTHARLLARDPSGAVADADILAIFQDVYLAYWETFLHDRVLAVTSFAAFSANQYLVEALVAVRDVLSLFRNAAVPNTFDIAPAQELERDSFEAVMADVEGNTVDNGILALPRRWGMRAKTDNSKPLIAIFPASSGVTLGAHVYPIRNTLSVTSPAGDLQGDDLDGYAVARLVACEVMGINGEDPNDIAGVFKLLDQKVQDKFRGIVWRAKPTDVGAEQ